MSKFNNQSVYPRRQVPWSPRNSERQTGWMDKVEETLGRGLRDLVESTRKEETSSYRIEQLERRRAYHEMMVLILQRDIELETRMANMRRLSPDICRSID